MNYSIIPYRIFPLGDTAITIDYGNHISKTVNKEVMARFYQLQQQPLPGMIEMVPAYSSLTIYYDVMAPQKVISENQPVYDSIKEQLEQRLQEPVTEHTITERLMRLPVCYEKGYAPDMIKLAAAKDITVDEVIYIHTSVIYKVYMLGFLPGFAYLGEVDEKIALPRKLQPQMVQPGSVGIAGKQTGIYPLASPGGWHIIGQTPVTLFKPPSNIYKEEASPDSNSDSSINNLTFLRAGDDVQFYSISKKEFEQIKLRS